jgi:hypothetical protein
MPIASQGLTKTAPAATTHPSPTDSRRLSVGADHRAIEVDGQKPKAELLDLLVKQLGVERDQRLKRLLRKLLRPVYHASIRRGSTKTQEQRVAGDVAHVFEPASTHDKKPDHETSRAQP